MAYAEHTKVPVESTKTEIERTLTKYGADRFAYFVEFKKAMIVFEANGRRLRFDLPIPEETEAGRRRKWRALLLCIKAKLESVSSKIETFEEAFLAHVVLPDGSTVYEHTAGRVDQIYKSEKMQALLPAPRGGNDG